MRRIIFLAIVLFSVFTGAAALWEIEIVDSSGDTGYDTSIVIDDEDNPNIAYYNLSSFRPMFAYLDDDVWDISSIASTDSGEFIDIAIDDSDNIYAIYADDTGEIAYAYYDGSSWQYEYSTEVGSYYSADINSDNYTCFSYQTNGDNLGYGFWSGTGWSFEDAVTSGNNIGLFSALAVDSEDIARIAYYDLDAGDLRYVYGTSGDWTDEIVDDTGNVGDYTSIALDDDDYPHIAYHDVTNGGLKYAYWDGFGWAITVVNGSSGYGSHTSIALDDDGYPHIAFTDENDFDLLYAYYDGNNWIIETVDSDGMVGAYCSLALDDNDNAHISYHSVDDLDLLYACRFPSEDEDQSDWSGGPNAPDFVTEWTNIFASENSVEWVAPGHLTLEEDKDFYTNGELLSAILDLGVDADPIWLEIDWNADTPKAVTEVTIQMRTGNAWGAMGAWSGDITMPGSLAGIVTDGQRYVQYKVKLSTTNSSVTPTFYDLAVTWEDHSTGIEDGDDAPENVVPTGFSLSSAYPNPSSTNATIKFALPYTCNAKLEVFDIKGRKIAVPLEGKLEAGEYSSDISGLGSGIYLYRLTTDDFTNTKKMIVR